MLYNEHYRLAAVKKSVGWFLLGWVGLMLTKTPIYATASDSTYEQYRREPNPHVKMILLMELAAMKEMRVYKEIQYNFQRSQTPEQMKEWLGYLLPYKNPKTVTTILDKASYAALKHLDNPREGREIIYEGLLAYGTSATGVLCWYLESPEINVRRLVSRLLEKFKRIDYLEYLIKSFRQNPDLKYPILAIGLDGLRILVDYYHTDREDSTNTFKVLVRMLENQYGREKVIKRMLRIPESEECLLIMGPRTYDVLLELIHDEEKFIREKSCRMLGKFKKIEVIPTLLGLTDQMYEPVMDSLVSLGQAALPKLAILYKELPRNQQRVVFSAMLKSRDPRSLNIISKEIRKEDDKTIPNIAYAAGRALYKRMVLKLMEIMAIWEIEGKWICYDSLMKIGKEYLTGPVSDRYAEAANEQMCLSFLPKEFRKKETKKAESISPDEISVKYLEELLEDDPEDTRKNRKTFSKSEKLLRNSFKVLHPLRLYKDELIVFSRLRKLSYLTFKDRYYQAMLFRGVGDTREMKAILQEILHENPDHPQTLKFMEDHGYVLKDGTLER